MGSRLLAEYMNIALPKGRLGEKAYAILEEIGYECAAMKEQGRKLVFEDKKNAVRYFRVKPSDVAVYVERGAADVGIVGKDILLEQSSDVYELLDLGIGKCRMAVAGIKGTRVQSDRTLRVATTFPHIAREYFRKRSQEIEIIKLNGSVEIAPMLNLSDVIVDIVETGTTLKENNMEPLEDIVDISARLIANKASYRFKNQQIREMCEKIQEKQKKMK